MRALHQTEGGVTSVPALDRATRERLIALIKTTAQRTSFAADMHGAVVDALWAEMAPLAQRGAHQWPASGDDANGWLTRDQVLRRLCDVMASVAEHLRWPPTDCCCGQGGYWATDEYGGTIEQGYRNDGQAVAFIERATREAMAAAPRAAGVAE